ncbi:hypothetical protein GN956_G13885 [Arapaima gigas]
MLHPIMIGIVTVNTTMTILYWAFILNDVFGKKLRCPDQPAGFVLGTTPNEDDRMGASLMETIALMKIIENEDDREWIEP